MEMFERRLRQISSADELDYTKSLNPKTGEGWVFAVAVDSIAMASNGLAAILMGANANRIAVETTLATGFATFYSRSRQELWNKGEKSGNKLVLRGVYADCDQDFVIYDVEPMGPACHLGPMSCFEETI